MHQYSLDNVWPRMCLTCQWKVGGRAMTRNEEKADSYEIRKMSVNMEGEALTNRSDKLTGSSWTGNEVEKIQVRRSSN
jgi:hypothetical protein